MSKFSKLKAGVAPVAVGLALVTAPAFAQDAAPQQAAAADATPAAGDQIVVTGSRIATPNLTSTSPITAVTAEDIKTTGTTKVEDLVNALPQVFAGQGSNISNGGTGISTLNLRGLGETRTLVLVNGRRVVPGDPGTSAADINIIPSSMVKRIDVLTGGASSVYGADAVSGVVNFVMDTKFDGFRVDSSYGFYQHDNRDASDISTALNARGFPNPKGSNAGGGTVDTTVSFGSGFDDGHGHITAYAGYRHTNAVLQADRDYSACNLAATSTANVAKGQPKFTCGGSSTSANGSFIVNVPNGKGGTTSTFFQVGANRTLVPGRTLYNFGPLNYYQRPDQRYTAGMFADYEISPALHPYMEFMFMDDRTVAQIAPSGDFGNTLSINCDNPLLSAQQKSVICSSVNLLTSPTNAFAITGTSGTPAFQFTDSATPNYTKGFAQILRRNVEGGGRQDDLEHTEYRGVIGMKGELGKAWNYDAYYQYGRTNYAETYNNDFSVVRLTRALDVVTSPTTGQPVCRSVLNGTDPKCVPYDIFGTGTVSSAALNYLQTPGFKRGINTENVVSGFVNGDLGQYGLKSPVATDGINLVLGGEYRRETLQLLTDTEFSTGDLAGQGGATLPVAGKFSVTEFFTEANIPLVQDSFIKSASIKAGYRRSTYHVSGNNTTSNFSTDTYKIEGEISPIADIKFRGGYNRAVRAPTLQSFFAAQNVALDGNTDPCAGTTAAPKGPITAADTGCLAQGLSIGQVVTPNSAAQYNGLTGGNPNLKPEVADTYTVGVVVQPRFIPGLSASADYFNIKIKGAIQGIGADVILAQCTGPTTTFFCSLIHRDQTGSLWRTPNGYVTDLTQNIGGASTKGIDFNVNYSYRLGKAGRLSFGFVGTYLDKLLTDPGINGRTPYDCANLYGAKCGTPNPKWRHQVHLGYDMTNGIGFSGRWRHFAGVLEDGTSSNPILTAATQPANYHIPSVDYFDLAMTARIGNHYTWRIGANNITDKTPPIVGTPACPGVVCNGNTFAQVYDTLGRYIYTGITLDF